LNTTRTLSEKSGSLLQIGGANAKAAHCVIARRDALPHPRGRAVALCWNRLARCGRMAKNSVGVIALGPMERSTMVAVRQPVELLEKNKPQQERAKRTYDAILAAAAELLVEVGVERISTNLVAERAGITVPALYRYFPNKYAVLNALGAVLMDKQNAVFQAWFDQYLDAENPQPLLDNIYQVLKRTYDVTRRQIGGLEVVQALRAVAPLQEVRLASHRLVAAQFAKIVADLLAKPEDESIRIQARLSIDTGYAIVEMALEDPSLPTENLLREGSRMIQLYWQDILNSR
jgi:AcrR family transcriptional regulator